MNPIWEVLLDRGISSADIITLKHVYLVLMMLPIVASIVSIARYVIGVKSLSLYAPIILTFAFYELGSTETTTTTSVGRGLKYGLVIYAAAFLSACLVYKIIKSLRMHYLPKISLVLFGTSISLIILIIFAAYIGKTGLVFLNTFSLIMIATASEGFISVYARKNFRYTMMLGIGTLIISIISFLVISWGDLQDTIMRYPWVMLTVIILNLYVGRFAGLRLTEYWRFRKLLLEEDFKDQTPAK